MKSDTFGIYPNKKTVVKDIEISCYGEQMIMVDHYTLPSPRPIGPSMAKHREAEGIDGFWDKSPTERTLAVLDHLDMSINWQESAPSLMLSLGRDITDARNMLTDTDKEINQDE